MTNMELFINVIGWFIVSFGVFLAFQAALIWVDKQGNKQKNKGDKRDGNEKY